LWVIPSHKDFKPNKKNKTVAPLCVQVLDIKLGAAQPKKAEKTVITARAPRAPEKTVTRECRIAKSAATKNVLSPISETTIIAMDLKKPCTPNK
jgi:hypothetical protein